MKKFYLLLIPLLVLLAMNDALAQRTIKGNVITDGDEQPIIGVNVTIPGADVTTGTVTDLDGNYELEVPADATSLKFSFVGYDNLVVTLPNDGNALDVKMKAGVALDEVVVTALGIKREEKTLGYAVQEVGGDAVSKAKESNFVQSLSGKVSGVQIKMPNTMGGSSNILVRGTASISNNNQALFVIDGVPINNNNTNGDKNSSGGRAQNQGWGGYDYGNAAMDINPDDIESISVLKGAAATALYGSRAANGVILITTKKGKARKGIGVTINTGYTASIIDPSTLPKHQNLYGGGYGPFYEDPSALFFYSDIDGDGVEDLIAPTSEDASWGAAFDPNLMVVHWDALDPGADNYGEKRPWVAPEHGFDYFFQDGGKWLNSVSIDGGNDKGTFRLSYANLSEKGILPNSKMNRNSLNFSSGYKFTDKLRFDVNASFIKSGATGRYGTGYDAGNVMQSFGQWYQTNVDFKRLEEKWLRPDGSQLTWNASYYNDLHPIYFDNPYWMRYKNFQDDERNRILGYSTLTYDITDFLSLTGRVAIDNYAEIQNERIAPGSVSQSYFSNFAQSFREVNTDVLLRFDKSFGDISVNAFGGFNHRDNFKQAVFSETVGGLVIPDYYAVANSTSPANVTERLEKQNVNSFLGGVNIGYKNFLFLEFTDRYDISSTLPVDNNAFNYYSISGSLILSELLGGSGSGPLSFAKLRANYAEVGNDAPVYSVYNIFSQGTNFGSTALFSVPSTLNNAELRPERTKSIEVGLEARFFMDRIGFDIAAYKNNSFDQIIPVSISRASGFAQKWKNSGEVENRGLEVAFNVIPVKTPNLTWGINVNWFANRNKVISLADGVTNRLIYSAWDASINATVGEPFGTIRGSDFVYTDGKKTVDENGYYMSAMNEETGEVIGDAIIGNINPDWNMGIGTNLEAFGIGLNVLFDIQKGGDIYSINTKYGQATGVYAETAALNDKGVQMRDPVEEGGGFRYPETVYADGTENTTYVPAFRWGRAFYYRNSPTARYVFDASYVKLREIGLSYRLPASLVKKSPFTTIELGLTGRNVAILMKNTEHFDPEASQSSGNLQGIESGTYPTTRNIGFNLRLGL